MLLRAWLSASGSPDKTPAPALAHRTTPTPPSPGRAPAQALVEFAFVMLWGMLSLMVLIDVGRLFYEYNAMRGGILMGSAQMQASTKYSGYATQCTTGYVVNPPASPVTTPCQKVSQIMLDASGLATAPSQDLYGSALPTGDLESITFTAVSGSLFTACGQYRITWNRPFLPVTPYARQLLGATGMALTLTAQIQGQHNNIPGGTAC